MISLSEVMPDGEGFLNEQVSAYQKSNSSKVIVSLRGEFVYTTEKDEVQTVTFNSTKFKYFRTRGVWFFRYRVLL